MEFKAALDELAITASEAFRFAKEGRVARGYLILKAGLELARESGIAEAGRLVELWSRVLAQFKEQFPRDWYQEVG